MKSVRHHLSLPSELDIQKITTNGLKYLSKGICVKYYESKRNYNTAADIPEIIEIKPADINWRSTFSGYQFPTRDDIAHSEQSPYDGPVVGVIGGPWDRYKQEWEDSVGYQSLMARFLYGEPWDQTEYYENELEAGAKCRDEVEDTFQHIEKLYDSMRQDGYISQSELLSSTSHSDESPGTAFWISIHGEAYPNESRVGIGRTGEIIRFEEGWHRISIAKILGLGSFPVIVVARHKKWQKIREKFCEYRSISDVPGKYRQYLGHPDLPNVE